MLEMIGNFSFANAEFFCTTIDVGMIGNFLFFFARTLVFDECWNFLDISILEAICGMCTVQPHYPQSRGRIGIRDSVTLENESQSWIHFLDPSFEFQLYSQADSEQ